MLPLVTLVLPILAIGLAVLYDTLLGDVLKGLYALVTALVTLDVDLLLEELLLELLELDLLLEGLLFEELWDALNGLVLSFGARDTLGFATETTLALLAPSLAESSLLPVVTFLVIDLPVSSSM